MHACRSTLEDPTHLAALAATQPVVLAIDDLQWAEPLLLDLTEHLVQWSTDVPLLVLVAARPELREARSSLTVPGGLVSEVVTLAGLEATAATRLAANVIGTDELPAAIAGRVLAASEGNPLFVSELVRMLVQDGALKREGDRWTTAVELADVEMPPTIQALLAARIERLRPEERTVLERAAVVGRQFSRAAITHLLPREITDLDARLEALRRSEMVEPDVGWFLGEPALRFHHVLIRDAAYRRILKGTRAELHARLADWLDSRAGDAVESDESIGWHLEQAHQHLRELGPIDEKGKRLGERASTHLAAAGRRALARDDLPLAGSLLGRAIDRLDTEDTARAELALDWCEALLAVGDVGPAAKAIAELARFVPEPTTNNVTTSNLSSRLRAWHTCFAGQLAVLTDPQALRTTANAVAGAAEELAAAGDAAGEAKAYSVHALALARLGAVGACEAALDRALAAARRGGDRRRSNAVLAEAPLAALWGPSQVTRASGRCLDVVRVLRITQGAPPVEAVALRCQAVLEALRGRADAARRMVASSRRMVEELGITQGLLETEMFAGLIELIEGDNAAAEHSLRVAYEGLRDHGLGIDAARAAALLGRTLLAQGRPSEAETLSHESEALAGDDLQASITWRRVRAEALARRGEHTAAVDFARAAVDIAAATDALLHHADARLALATALRAAGRNDEAAAEQTRAIELWETKGATVLAERARRASERPVSPAVKVVIKGDARPQRSRVRSNAATDNAARLDAAVTAQDADALRGLWAEDAETVEHYMGVTYDREAALHGFALLWRALDVRFRTRPLATLGDSLGLFRNSLSYSAIPAADFTIGAVERDLIFLIEVEANGRTRRHEHFAPDRLGDAIARLYERHADLLEAGRERDRAAAIARSVMVWNGSLDLDRFAPSFAPSIVCVDHRILGTWSTRGAEEHWKHWRAQFDVADANARDHEVLALEPDAFLVRRTWSGTDRVGGGSFENVNLALFAFGADGLLARVEVFDPDRDDDALARFDELTAQRAIDAPAIITESPRAVRRSPRANAATALIALFDAAIAARDVDALASLFVDEYEFVHHPSATAFGRDAMLSNLRDFIGARDQKLAHEPLATLGDALVLCRLVFSFSELVETDLPIGAVDMEAIVLVEADTPTRHSRVEEFAANRLGDAVVRLYERYAELLPDGPARERAAATARSVATVLGPFDPEGSATAYAPAIEWVDHRTLGTWSARGAEAMRQHWRSVLELADDVTVREDDVLGLRSDAFLGRRTHVGTDRATGGAYERQFLWLAHFGTDGLVAHIELFDADDDAQALARFDEIMATPSLVVATRDRCVTPNFATAGALRLNAAMARGDADAIPALFADEIVTVDHGTGGIYDRDGTLFSLRALLKAKDPAFVNEPLATLGDSLSLCRLFTSANGFAGGAFDVGAYQREELIVIEADAQGRRRWAEVFPTYRLGDAVVRLYERYAELLPDGPTRQRAAAAARAIGAHVGPLKVERFDAALAADFEFHDHRSMGLGALSGKKTLPDALRSLVELAADAANRIDDVLRLQADGFLIRMTNHGTQRVGGGVYERPFLMLALIGAGGSIARMEQFDIDQEHEAAVRWHELTSASPAARVGPPLVDSLRTPPNAATQTITRWHQAVADDDWDAVEALFAPTLMFEDRRRGFLMRGDREMLLASTRAIATTMPRTARTVLATAGDRLALERQLTAGTNEGGTYEVEFIEMLEVDAAGRLVAVIAFDPHDRRAAALEMVERYSRTDDGRWMSHGVAFPRALITHDLELLRAALPDDFVFHDHRRTGIGRLEGAHAYVEWIAALFEQSPDALIETLYYVTVAEHGFVAVGHTTGTLQSGGEFESIFVQLGLRQGDRIVGGELFELDDLDLARARFDELCAQSAEPPVGPMSAALAERFENAAARAGNRIRAAMEARDWERFAALFPAGFRSIDRQRMALLEGDRDRYLEAWRPIFEAFSSSSTISVDRLATRGDRLGLARTRWTGSGHSVGPSEFEWLVILEVDQNGDLAVEINFDANDLDAAYAELDARYAAGEAASYPVAFEFGQRIMRGNATRDLEALAALCAPDFIVEDHTPLGWGTLDRATYFESLKAMAALTADSRVRTDHIRLCDRGALGVHLTFGTHEGGAFEQPRVTVSEIDAQGRERRRDMYTWDQLDEAWARFAELARDHRRSDH